MRKIGQITLMIATGTLIPISFFTSISWVLAKSPITEGQRFQAVSQSRAKESQLVAQTSPQPSLPAYEDDIIKVTVARASFDRDGFAQVNLSIQNKTAQDLLLALEAQWPTVISDSGESGACDIAGIKTSVGTTNSVPTNYSRLKPKQKLTVSLSRCRNFRTSSPLEKVNSISINMPLVRLENEKPTPPFTVDLSDIPIKK